MRQLYQYDKLYLAIMANDEKRISKLKADGAAISDHIKYALTHSVGGAKMNEYSWTWYSHNDAIFKMEKDKFIAVVTNLHNEIGESMHYTDSFYWELHRYIFDRDVFKCLLDCFNNKKINKKFMMEKAIDADNVEILSIAAEHGWLKAPRKRDEMIKYATDNNKTECLAWLLDFKNRTANLAEEQEKAEKKFMRELNASPDSVSELKKRWGWKNREDGTLIITSCKKSIAGRTQITVPEKIGKVCVSAIAEYAFSSYAPRVWGYEIGRFRDTITQIILPDSIETIGGSAFHWCKSLEEVNIPDKVLIIEEKLFSQCYKLKKVTLPSSLLAIEKAAFAACKELEEINMPDSVCEIGPYAFNVCESIKKVRVPKGVEEIGERTFGSCISLEELELPQGLKKIGKNAFEKCKILKTIVIPEGVEEIDRLAFAECDALETVYLPQSLKKIKNLSVKNAAPNTIFYKCPNVKAIVCEGSYAYKYCRRNGIPYEINSAQ